MRLAFHSAGYGRRATLSCVALTIAAVVTSCSSSTDAPPDPSTITYISGGNQTVTVNSSGLTDLPQLVLVRVDSMGIALAGRDISVSVHMNGAPGPNGPSAFVTGADGIASMQLQLSNIHGPVSVRASYTKCVDWGLFGCDRSVVIASVSVPGIVAQ
ncbi:MAG: hypothetical protein ACJ772_03080 [Gemmatimonadaceae bacterium]